MVHLHSIIALLAVIFLQKSAITQLLAATAVECLIVVSASKIFYVDINSLQVAFRFLCSFPGVLIEPPIRFSLVIWS